MSIESTPSTSPTTEQETADSPFLYVLLWFWKEQPGGDLIDVIYDKDYADYAIGMLGRHGDPSKAFKLIVL